MAYWRPVDFDLAPTSSRSLRSVCGDTWPATNCWNTQRTERSLVGFGATSRHLGWADSTALRAQVKFVPKASASGNSCRDRG
jgi:hypothetical protein